MWIYPTDSNNTQEHTNTGDVGQQAVSAHAEYPLPRFSEDVVSSKSASNRRMEHQGITPIPHPPKPDRGSDPPKTPQPRPNPAQPFLAAEKEKTSPPSEAPKNRPKPNTLPTQKAKNASANTTVLLFAAFYALGSLLAGVVRASFPDDKIAFLQFVSQEIQSLPSAQPFELFSTLFLIALFQVTAVALMSLCAFGVPLMALLITANGLGAGLLAIELILGRGFTGLLQYLICIGIYHAVLSAGMCMLGKSGAQLATNLFADAFSASSHRASIAKTQTSRFLKRYLQILVLLLLLCGLCAAAAGVSGQALGGLL